MVGYKRYLEAEDLEVPKSTRYFRTARPRLRNEVEHVDEVLDPVEDLQEVGLSLEDNPEAQFPVNVEVPSPSSASSEGNDSDFNSSEGDISDHATSLSDEEQQPPLAPPNSGPDNIFMRADNINQENAHPYVYPGALITQTQSEALILSFAIRHHLSEIALRDLLLLINAHTPTVIHQSKYHFLKNLNASHENTIEHCYFCEFCKSRLQFELDVDQCNNEGCNMFEVDQQKCDLQVKNCFFLHMPLRPQLEKLLNTPDIISKLSRDHHTASNILSGEIYQGHLRHERIGPKDITLQWNTDGASASKSSKCSIWPLQVAINELPYRERKANIMLTSLWQGVKPEMDTFLRPFVEELKDLNKNGITLSDGQIIKVHCLVASVDSVARPLLQNIKQFNGKFGCSYCLKPTKQCVTANRQSRIYNGDVGELRTNEQHLQDVMAVVKTGVDHINGVKGPSLLMMIPLFNIISSMVPDYMHNVLLGVTRWVLCEWLDSNNSNCAWYINPGSARVLSTRLEEIKPLTEITRAPRTLEDRRYWKASEFRSFLLYYSIPCLQNILPLRYIKHWMLLVFAITTMLQEKIIDSDFQLASQAIREFVLQTKDLYGEHFLTYNVHTLLHLPASVNNWGALWDSSNFMYEHFNGVLLNLFFGTQHISAQIFKNYDRIKKVNHLINNTPFQNWHPMAETLLTNLSGKYLSLQASQIKNLVVLGTPKVIDLNIPEQIAIENLTGHQLQDYRVKSFTRFIYNGIKLNVSSYSRLVRRENSTVLLQGNVFFEISKFVELGGENASGQERNFIIVGKKLHVLNYDICSYKQIKSSKFLKLIDIEKSYDMAIKPLEITSKCVRINVDEKTFICEMVNSIERD